MEISDKKDKSEVIFLIGAGASVPIGIPAMYGIYRAFIDKRKSGISAKEKKTCQLLTKELGVKEDLEEFLLASNSIISFEDTSLLKLVEKLVSIRKSSSKLLEFRKKFNYHLNDIRSVRTKILEFMSRTCFQFDRKKSLNIFGNFIKSVSSCSYPIYTTNYDYALEHVAQEKHIPICDNFVQEGQRHIWNPQIEFPVGNALTIIKLHGSVIWYTDQDGLIERIYANTDINPIGQDIERIVVFPTRFKDIYDQHFFALYSHFLTSLSKAKCLVIIGHSLRDEYLRAGIIERVRKGGFRVIIIDPKFPSSLPAEMKPSRLGSVGKVTHVPYAFEKFSDDLAWILDKSDPNDIALECAEVVRQSKIKTNKIRIKGNIGHLKPGQKKTFKAVVDAYIPKEHKPAYVRVWLKAKYTLPSGEKREEVSASFIEDKKTSLAEGLSGVVDKEIPITINISAYDNWIKYANKITLYVGISTKFTKKPVTINKLLLASDKRELTYS